MENDEILTIIIPTKDRFELLVKNLNYYKYNKKVKLLVVDNSSYINKNKSKNLESYINSRSGLEYIQTGSLTMHENFKAGYELASTKWVSYAYDKYVINNNKLDKLLNLIEKLEEGVIVFKQSIYWTEFNTYFENDTIIDGKLSSSEIKNYFEKKLDFDFWKNKMPRLHNCAFSKNIPKHEKDIFDGLSPDVTAGFVILESAKEINYLNETIFINTSPFEHSGGHNINKNPEKLAEFYDENNIIQNLDNKYKNSTKYTIIKDYLQVSCKLKYKESKIDEEILELAYIDEIVYRTAINKKNIKLAIDLMKHSSYNKSMIIKVIIKLILSIYKYRKNIFYSLMVKLKIQKQIFNIILINKKNIRDIIG